MKLSDFIQVQIMFNVERVGSAIFTSAGTVTYAIEPSGNEWSIRQKDANDMRSTPFTTFQKEVWSTEDMKTFFKSQDFSKMNQAFGFTSPTESQKIETREVFLALFEI